MRSSFLMMGCCILMCIHAFAQSDTVAFQGKNTPPPAELLAKLQGTTAHTQQQLLDNTSKSLHKLRLQEEKMLGKVNNKDSLLNGRSVLSTTAFYDGLEQRLAGAVRVPGKAFSDVYSSKLDSLRTAVKFLAANKILQSPQGQDQYQKLLSQYGDLQRQLNETNSIGQLLEARQQSLLASIPQLGSFAGFRKMQQQVVEYKAKINTCKELWENPSEIESKLTGLLAKMPEFRKFFNGNSELGSIFQLGGAGAGNAANAANLQTRDALNRFISQATGGSAAAVQTRIQEGIDPAAGAVNSKVGDLQKLADLHKEDLGLSASGKSLKPKKTFKEHLQYSTNIQTVRASNFFPATSDIGLGLGYKLNDRSVVGLGGSGKIGWGKGFQNIQVTGQGLSLRSFADVKLKGSIWISGGWEFNYQQPYTTLRMLRLSADWKQSALLGITKKINIGSKLFKTYEVKLLYDFLYRYQLPVTSPVKFRIGYSL